MRLTRSQISVLMLGILTLLTGLVTNVASNQIPDRVKPYLWWSWPLLILLAIAFLVLTLKNEKNPDGVPRADFSLKHYYEALLKRYRTLDLDALTPPQREEYLQLQLQSVFVEQSVRESPPPIELPKEILEKLQSEGELKIDDLPEGLTIEEIRASGDQYYKNPVNPVIEILTSSQTPHAVILGDPGSGKSTLTRYIILSMVDSGGDSRLRRTFDNFLPVLIELRTYNALREERKCDTFLEFIEFLGKTEGWNLTQAVLHERLTKGGVVIFDGLDEIFDPADRERISHAIVGFTHTYPKAAIIVTSRIVGYQRKTLTDAGFVHYTLQDLNREQVESFVTRWYELALADRPDDAERLRARILQSFDQSNSVRQLAGNPMLLTIMAIIGKHQELPRERWKLYDHAISVLIEHWEVKRHLEKLNVDAPFIGEDDKKELLRRLAFRMQAGSGGLKGNYIHRDQLQDEFHDYLVERFTLSPDRATTISRIMIDQFRQRNFILSLYGASVYGFVHRAFLEYFCATAFTYKFEKAHEISIDELAEKVFGAHWQDQSWHEVLRLICGILNERFAGKLISHLLSLGKSPGLDPMTPLQNMELALRCLGEVRNLNSIVDITDSMMDLLIQMFDDPTSRKMLTTEVYKQWGEIVEAIKAIGAKWPNRVRLARLLKEWAPNDSAWVYAFYFGSLVNLLGAGLEAVRLELVSYAGSEDRNRRSLWPYALALGWKDDPATLSLLKKQMLDDPEALCRREAISVYRSIYRDDDPEGVSLMRMILQREESGMVRSEAINYLWFFAEESSNAVFNAHLNDDDTLVRATAFNALKNELTLPMLLDRVAKESSKWLREELYSQLAKKYSGDSQARESLLKGATDEKEPFLRANLLNLLAKHFAGDPKTLDFLRARQKDDSNQLVREHAEMLMRDHERPAN